jgi:AcrR family transcriptional regulator
MSQKESANSNNLTKKERQVIRKKGFILDAAKKLFSEKTFESITMEEIADLAALSRATLYNYFNTKEEIYFNIGLTRIEQWIEEAQSVNLSEYNGKEIVLFLTGNLVGGILEFPHYSKLLRRFFDRSHELGIPIEEIFYDSISKIKNIKEKKEFEEQYLIFFDLLESYIKYRQIWQDAINKGINDDSITLKSNPIHLNFIIIMLVLGFLDQVDFRRSLMEIVDIRDDNIKNFLLTLVKKVLEGDLQPNGSNL